VPAHIHPARFWFACWLDISWNIVSPGSTSRHESTQCPPAAWKFHTLDTLRHRFIQRAGRLIRPQGNLTLIMSANPAVREDLLHFLDAVTKAAA
jgi:hypothetical protein